MIKNIDNLKKCQIICKNQEQVKNCLNYLEQLGFDVEDFTDYYDGCNIVLWGEHSEKFVFSDILKGKITIEFYNKKLVKTLQKLIKEKEKQEKVKDFEVAEDGRIIKVNNWMSKKQIFLLFIRDKAAGTINRFSQDCLIKYVNLGLVYSTEEARDRAMFKLEIETKLKNIAERLNNGGKIDWEDEDQTKFIILYNYRSKILGLLDLYGVYRWKYQGGIYCLDKNFLDVAKQEIGEDNLIKYFKE